MAGKWMLRGFRGVFGVVQWAVPSAAERWAVRLWFTPVKNKAQEKRMELPPGFARTVVPFGHSRHPQPVDAAYTVYRWGQGPRVLLAHGWGGHASQLGSLVPPLVEAGFEVVAYDALGHGASVGGRTDVMDMARTIEEIGEKVGGFHAIVAHSLGAAAAALALEAGVLTTTLVVINSAASVETFMRRFSRLTGASPRTMDYLRHRIEWIHGRALHTASPAPLLAKAGVPGLVVFDHDDWEFDPQEGLELAVGWGNATVMATRGLGHRRILDDPAVVEGVVKYVKGMVDVALIRKYVNEITIEESPVVVESQPQFLGGEGVRPPRPGETGV
jgi:pimeloyl-ACP methyl ester carboxylesterase